MDSAQADEAQAVIQVVSAQAYPHGARASLQQTNLCIERFIVQKSGPETPRGRRPMNHKECIERTAKNCRSSPAEKPEGNVVRGEAPAKPVGDE